MRIALRFGLAVASALWLLPSAHADDPGPILTTDKPVKVLMLNGMRGKGSFKKARDIIEDSEFDADIDVQIWDWTDLDEFDSLLSVVGLNILEVVDRLSQHSEKANAAARRLAQELVAWRQAQDEVREDTCIHVYAGSAGVLILRLACYATHSDDPFDRDLDRATGYVLPERFFQCAVLVCAAIDFAAPIGRVDACTVDGIYNYYSARDTLLIKAEPIAYKTPLVGLLGYKHSKWDDEMNAQGDQYRFIRRELRWSRSLDLDNDGSHMDCNDKKYFRRFLLPLFDPNGTAPPEWEVNIGWRREP